MTAGPVAQRSEASGSKSPSWEGQSLGWTPVPSADRACILDLGGTFLRGGQCPYLHLDPQRPQGARPQFPPHLQEGLQKQNSTTVPPTTLTPMNVANLRLPGSESYLGCLLPSGSRIWHTNLPLSISIKWGCDTTPLPR